MIDQSENFGDKNVVSVVKIRFIFIVFGQFVRSYAIFGVGR